MSGRTMLVTGAGRGIGRVEALYLAAEGANVVVNDPGVEIDGSGGDGGVAEAVVAEILDAGGRAVADTGDVADWNHARRMVDVAVEAFGDLHVVVNNAAIEVNRPLERLSESEFDDVVAVKLKAVHAVELARLGVRVNCVSPSMVHTRLTVGVPGMDRVPAGGGLDPKDPVVVAPLVAYLASAGCPLTGPVLSVRGGVITVNAGWSRGAEVTKDGALWTVPELAAQLEALELEDPFERLASALGGALGAVGRAQLETMVADQLNA